MMFSARWVWFAVICFVVGFPTVSVSGQSRAQPLVNVNQPDRVVWGFNGRVVPFTFNPVSILLDNPNPVAFDGVVELKISGFDSDFNQTKAMYLAPGTRRWVQFSVYMEEGKIVDLEWYDQKSGISGSVNVNGENSSRFGSHSFTHSAGVILMQEDDVNIRDFKLPSFSENLFPVNLSATDGLKMVVLDHKPRWVSPGRTKAFIDWIKKGGQLYICHGRDGSWPEFTGELAVLNPPLEEFRLGLGRVYHIAKRPNEAQKDGAWREMTSSNKLNNNQSSAYQVKNKYEMYDQGWLEQLRKVVEPVHQWGLIVFLCIIYLILLGPVYYFVVRNRKGYRTGYVILVGCVGLFTWVMMSIGARGYGEKSQAITVGYAHQLSDGEFDVTQWVNLFTTEGATYQVDYGSEDASYTSLFGEFAKRGEIVTRKHPTLVVDIPLYSHQPYMVRSRMKGPKVNAEVLSVKRSRSDMITDIRLKLDPVWGKHIKRAWVRVGSSYAWCNLKMDGDGVILRYDQDNGRRSFYSINRKNPNHHNRYRRRNDKETAGNLYEKIISEFGEQLIRHSYEGRYVAESESFSMPSHEMKDVELYLLVDPPEGLRLKSDYFKQQLNRLMIRIPVNDLNVKGETNE